MSNVSSVSEQHSEDMARAMVDCAREPIHIPGGIQPHGFLFCVTDDGIVMQASENVALLAQKPLDEVLGKPLSSVLGDAAAPAISALASLDTEGVPLYVGSIDDPRGAVQRETRLSPLAIVVHRYQRIAFVELEPARGTADVFSSMYPLVRTFINRLQEVQSVADLAALAAQEVQRITGYGRTLVYDFDDEGNGHVIAEALDEGYQSYMDQRFPGSDIPPQARALYVRNRIRLIADADYAPAPLVPALNPVTHAPTDLTYASLRSVSPVHVQYMKNMGTWSSMSMSIVVRGKLWGLISCHHASARVPPFEVRTACEHIAQVLSLQVEAKEDHAEAEHRLELRRRQSHLLATMANTDHFIDALANDPRELLALTNSTGAAIVFDGRIVPIGNAPDRDTIEQLVAWLDTQSDDIYSTDDLAQAWGRPANPEHAGMLALSISKLFRNYVIWFRAEVVRTLKWAGDPRAKLSSLSASLSPRESFDTWTETVRGRSSPWRQAELEIAVEFRTALLGIVLRRAEELAQLALELGRANEELEGFSYTVSHDLRAPLRHIVGFADLLREMESAKLSERGQHFVERIMGAARFGGKLVDDLLAFSQMGRAALRPQGVDLRALTQTLIADEQRNAGERPIDWRIGDLPQVTADPVLLHVVLRNLIENAVKFSRLHDDPNAPAVIEISSRPGEDDLAGQRVVFVRDNGVGFDMRYVDKLFGVFQRLHRAEEFEGTGIGLASVRRIVERHGGKTWAEGELGKGATIFFSLPLTFTPDANARDESPTAAVARLAALSPGQPFRPVPKESSVDSGAETRTSDGANDARRE
ncbi:Phytochrome, two-component sensor histidine kinase [Paraburkholderia sabiae]|uniref:ATP-binding protein n=1 Tax=Paraburkholderia sabiae TaxID=273251 RepID=UPI001CB41143|nr:ATP-binding protein [Paraburkholderia sabiae]CAG9195821.1 Phytochrome, two-component sensor histidine kinase [Paraburkholderia sabiae]